MTLRPVGIHHVAICVDDLDAAIVFYTEVLGLHLADRPDTLPNPGAWLDLGAQQVHLLAGDHRGPGTFAHFSVLVDDLDATAAMLLAEHEVVVRDRQVIDGYGEQGFIDDPCGNLVELYDTRWPRSQP